MDPITGHMTTNLQATTYFTKIHGQDSRVVPEQEWYKKMARHDPNFSAAAPARRRHKWRNMTLE